jgi:hypothetical protein
MFKISCIQILSNNVSVKLSIKNYIITNEPCSKQNDWMST